jgi:hypothetical protein
VEKLGTPVNDIVDFWHVLEKLAAAAEVIFAAMSVAHLLRWKLKLLITYLENNGERMNYADARQKGLPIGSGNTEATCKSLFGLRMKRSGSRWKELTGAHIVHLRALALSDRWDDGITLALSELRTPVRAAA